MGLKRAQCPDSKEIDMKKSISTRIRITRTGKMVRRPMGIGHSKAKKSGVVNQKKRKSRNLEGIDAKFLTRYVRSI